MPRLQSGPRHIRQAPVIGPIREITRADLPHLAVKRTPTPVQTLRDSHHRIARALASGMRDGEVCVICGVSQSRIFTLKQDPAFQDLIAHYRAMVTVDWASAADPVISYLDEIKLKSLAMIADKIDAAAAADEFLPSRDLATFAELGLDRTGYGKVNKNVNVNIDFAAKLEAMRSRSRGAGALRSPPSIEAVSTPATPHPPRSAPAVPSPSLVPRRAPSTFRRI